MLNSKPKLLIVDDEPTIVEIVSDMLSPCAYDIRMAYDGQEAVLVAQEFRPDCVVTGVVMPKMDGFEEATAILQFLPTCKFVFMSGSAHKIRAEYEQHGPYLGPLLSKPFTRLELLNALALAGFPNVFGPWS